MSNIQPDTTGELDKIIKQIFSLASSNENLINHKAITMEEWFANQDANIIVAKAAIEAYTASIRAEERIAGMEQAKSRVLRRTEIPKDARNPTRDGIVILGEQIASFIEQDIADVRAVLANKETES